MKKLLIVPIFLFLGFISCQNKENSQTTQTYEVKVDSVVYNYETPKVITPNGDTTSTSIYVKYPKLSGGNEQAIAKINAFMEDLAKRGLAGAGMYEEDSVKKPAPASLEEAGKTFLNAYEDFKKEMPESGMGWYFEGGGDTTYISPKIIGIFYTESVFTGGAHGNYNTSLLNFDAQTGELLKLTDIISDTTALKKIAEVKFYENEQKEAKAGDFEFDKSMYFWDSPFFLPQNVGITKEGLQFLYNPYEAAAYARGQISFTISWKDLDAIVRKERIF